MKRCERISKLISRTRPKYTSWDCYLYISQPLLLLRGYALDMPPGACYVWKFMFPLFKSFSVVDLNIGYRLNNAYIPTTGLSDEEIADSVVHRIDGDVGFKEEEDVVELMTFASNELASRSARRGAAEAIELYVASEDRDLLVSANENMRRLKIA